MLYETSLTARPPQIAGDVDIARFLSVSEKQQWRVSIAGMNHFLTDAATAWRIKALALPAGTEDTYERAYARYQLVAGETVESLSEFVVWCRRHRSHLERLAETPDNHAMALRCRLLNDVACKRLATPLASLFQMPVLVSLWVVCLGIVGFFLLRHDVAYHDSSSFWSAVALALVGVFIHELGHITACVRYGARQGGIGVGVYWIWPAFFADVRGSWSLPSGQRLLISLGGLYFQSIYVATLSIVAFFIGSAKVAVAIQITLLLMATTLNPIFKYDGYWILSDALNVTNLHKRIGVHIQGLIVGKGAQWRSLLWSRWTGVCLLFVCTAIAYIGYVLFMLGRAAVVLMSDRIPAAYQAFASIGPTTTEARRWSVYVDGTLLGLQSLLVLFAFIVLGGIALRATFKFAVSRGERA